MKKHTLLFSLIFSLSFGAHATRIDLLDGKAMPETTTGISGCSSNQQMQIRVAEKSVGLKLDELDRDWHLVDLTGVKRDFVDPEGRMWVDGNPRHGAYQTYWRDMGSLWKQMRSKSAAGINFECKDLRERNCQGGEVFAYVLFFLGQPRSIIYLCPGFFNKDPGSQAETVMHELSHYAASTEDYANDWLNGANSDLRRAVKDAYHIEQFTADETARVLRRFIWFWFWPKPRIQ